MQWVNQSEDKSANPSSESITVENTQPTAPSQSSSLADELAKAKATVEELLSRGANIAESYDDYLKLGFALADGLGAEGHDLYHQLCAQSSKYRETDCEKKWLECLGKSDGRTSIATFYKMAQDAGVDLSAISRQFPSVPPNPHAEGEKVVGIVNTINSIVSTISTQGEGSAVSAVNSTEDEGEVAGGYSETFSNKIDSEQLPPYLRDIAQTQETPEEKDKMLLGSMCLTSGAMPNVYGIYDKRRVNTPFYAIIDAPPSSDKGSLNACAKLLEPIEKDIEQRNQLEQEEYQQKMAAYMALDKSKRAATTAPQEPPYRSLWIPANSSATSCYQALADNEGWGITMDTEADTVSNALKSDYGNYSDGLRKAFHHETISYNRRKENEHIKIYHPRWAIFLTCTPGQIPQLFPSVENGTDSRFIFYNLPRKLFWRNVFDNNKKTLDDQFLEFGQRYKRIFDELVDRKGHPLEFVLTPSQQELFNKFFAELQFEQVSLLGDDLIAFVRRLGLVCFRIAMILTVLRQEGSSPMFDPLSQTLVCIDEDFQTAMIIANCLINHTAHVYTNLIAHGDNNGFNAAIQLSSQEANLFKELGNEFTTAECREAAARLNIPWRTAERYVGQFVSKYHLAIRIRNGLYKKKL